MLTTAAWRVLVGLTLPEHSTYVVVIDNQFVHDHAVHTPSSFSSSIISDTLTTSTSKLDNEVMDSQSTRCYFRSQSPSAGHPLKSCGTTRSSTVTTNQ